MVAGLISGGVECRRALTNIERRVEMRFAVVRIWIKAS